MEAAAVLRMLASLTLVLGFLAVALWAVRRFDLRLPGRTLSSGRLALVERLSLDPKRSLVLIRRDGREHLLLLSPDGAITIETAIKAPAPIAGPSAQQPHAPSEPVPFARLVEQGLAAVARRRAGRDRKPEGVSCDRA